MSDTLSILTFMTSPVPALLAATLFVSCLLIRAAARIYDRSHLLALLGGLGGLAGFAWGGLCLSGRLSALLGVSPLGSGLALWAALLLLYSVIGTVQLLPEVILARCPGCGLPLNPRAQEAACWRCIRAHHRAHARFTHAAH